MEKMSLFGKDRSDEDNLIKKTGKGIITVGTIIGAGVLLGMGIGAVTGD